MLIKAGWKGWDQLDKAQELPPRLFSPWGRQLQGGSKAMLWCLMRGGLCLCSSSHVLFL